MECTGLVEFSKSGSMSLTRFESWPGRLQHRNLRPLPELAMVAALEPPTSTESQKLRKVRVIVR